MPNREESLAGIEIFADLPPDDLVAVGQRCRWRHCDSEQQILGHMDDTHDVYFIVKGEVRATVYALSGKEVTFRDIGAGQIFGEFAAIDGKPRSANVVALKPSVVASLSAAAFWEVLLEHPEVAASTLKLLTKQIRVLSERVFDRRQPALIPDKEGLYKRSARSTIRPSFRTRNRRFLPRS